MTGRGRGPAGYDGPGGGARRGAARGARAARGKHSRARPGAGSGWAAVRAPPRCPVGGGRGWRSHVRGAQHRGGPQRSHPRCVFRLPRTADGHLLQWPERQGARGAEPGGGRERARPAVRAEGRVESGFLSTWGALRARGPEPRPIGWHPPPRYCGVNAAWAASAASTRLRGRACVTAACALLPRGRPGARVRQTLQGRPAGPKAPWHRSSLVRLGPGSRGRRHSGWGEPAPEHLGPSIQRDPSLPSARSSQTCRRGAARPVCSVRDVLAGGSESTSRAASVARPRFSRPPRRGSVAIISVR